jgi:hypothetical protein
VGKIEEAREHIKAAVNSLGSAGLALCDAGLPNAASVLADYARDLVAGDKTLEALIQDKNRRTH